MGQNCQDRQNDWRCCVSLLAFVAFHRLQSTVVNDFWKVTGRPWESQGIGATLEAAIKDWAYKNGQRLD